MEAQVHLSPISLIHRPLRAIACKSTAERRGVMEMKWLLI